MFSFFFLLLLLNTLLSIVPHVAIEDLLHVIKLLFGRAWDNVIRTVAYRFLWCSKKGKEGILYLMPCWLPSYYRKRVAEFWLKKAVASPDHGNSVLNHLIFVLNNAPVYLGFSWQVIVGHINLNFLLAYRYAAFV